MGLITKLNNIATAISNKTGQPASEYTLDNMPTAIGAIQTSFPAPTTTDKPVRFIDYDGTIVSEMTYEQAAALTSLPEGPTHAGLTFTNWTSTLAAVQSVTSPNSLDVGAIYEDATSHDNATVMTVCPQKATTAGTITLNFNQSVANGVTIDWGDGSATETVAGTGNVTATHAYSGTLAEDYDISLSPASGCQLTLGGGTSSTALMGNSYYVLKSIRVGNATLSQYCFYQCRSLTEAILSTHIGETLANNSFYNCYTLTSVVIPNSVTSISNNAFYNCYGLTSAVIPNSVTSISSNAFYNCYGLTSVVIPNSVTSISSNAFYNCSALTSVVIPNSVTSIGDASFYTCSALTSVVIPNSVTSIGGSAFAGCYGLTSVVIPNSVTSIGGNAFYNCYGLTSVVIPNSVTSIGGNAFYNCYGLTSAVIPNSVTSIGSSAFAGCYGLTEVSFGNRTANMPTSSWMGSDTKIERLDFTECEQIPNLTSSSFFSNMPTYTKIVVPDALYDNWIVATNWSSKANQIVKESEA